MATQPESHPSERAALTRPCRSRRNAGLRLAVAGYVHLDAAHEEAALAALADLLGSYTDPDDMEAA